MARRVLLVEDDTFAQELVTAILLSANIESDIASDGFVAVQRMQTQSYAIALVDYHLPEMDGYALAKLLRDAAMSRGESFCLVGLTADRNGLAARRGADTLFDAIVLKPFEPQRLIELVRSALRADSTKCNQSRDAAKALLAKPEPDHARAAAAAFWRTRGLDRLPKITVLPDPTPDQIVDLSLCFEIVAPAAAELVMLLDIRGLGPLMKLKAEDARLPPVVTLDRALAPVADVVFDVADPGSWSEVAARHIGFWTPASRQSDDIAAVQTEVDLAVHHDRDALLKVSSLFGPDRTQLLLSEFAQNLKHSFAVERPSQHDGQLLMSQVRSLMSAGDTLGFLRFADTCRELQTAIRTGEDLLRPLGKVKAAKLRTLRTLSQMQISETTSMFWTVEDGSPK